MAQEQIRELMHLLGEERDLTNGLQDRLDQEIIMSQALEIGAHSLSEKHSHALEAVEDLRSQKDQMLAQIANLEVLCGERYERIAFVERELQKAKSLTPESQGSADMEIGGVSLTATTDNGSCKMSTPGPTRPRGYAVCLIDGNHLLFTYDSIYTLGGDTTAKRLIEGVRSLLQDEDMDLRVAIYVDMDHIAQAMVRGQLLRSLHDFQPFADSFNSVIPGVEMVDTRNRQRATRVLKLHLEDRRCEFILFGGEISRDLMSLAQQYKDIERHFYAFSKPEELTQPNCRDYINSNPLGYLFCHHPFEHWTPSQLEPKPPSARLQIDNGSSFAHPQVVHEPVTFDRLGRRIDPRLHTTQPLINLVTSWKLCNNHYLLGKCLYTRCHHSHNRQLSKDQLNALAFLGRSLICRNGSGCDDPTCYAGHTCPRRTCDGHSCGFSRDRHLKGTIKAPQILNSFNTTTTQDTSNTSTSISSPASGRAVLPDATRTSNANVNPAGTVAAHWSRMRDDDEPLEDRPDLFEGRHSSWRQHR